MKRVKISVVIPTYKPAGYLWKCLEALACQTLPKSLFEVIVVLNGCGEPWNGAIEAWIKEHPELDTRLVQTDTPGVSNARNAALDMARGEFIAFIDDDDYVSAAYLEELLKVADKETLALSDSIAFTDGVEGFDEDYPMHRTFMSLKDDHAPTLAKARATLNGPCMKLISREMIEGARFDVSFKNGEDSLFVYEISKNIKKVAFADASAVYYRRFRPGSAVTSKKSVSYIITNSLRLSFTMFRKFLRAPLRYNLPFTVTRITAPLKSMIIDLAK